MILVVGTGYVGLVSGACLAALGHRVTCIDQDMAKIDNLNRSIIPIHEPGLDELVQEHLHQRLNFSTQLQAEAAKSKIVFLAVGTPARESGEADVSQLFAAAGSLCPALQDGVVIVIKSTVPVGTAKALRNHIKALRPDLLFSIISNPEFLREGSAIADFMSPDRIVLGHGPEDDVETAKLLYAPLTIQGFALVTMSNEAAEVAKYAANTYLALRIAYVNELADLCEAVGADITSVTKGMSLDRRIGGHYLQPGPGFGGSCFPKDVTALLSSAEAVHTPMMLAKAVVQANNRRKHSLVTRVARAAGGVLTGKTVTVLGLAFKANTDDTRDSAALQLIDDLMRRGATVRCYDPAVKALEVKGITTCASPYHAAEAADVAVILTEWDEFRTLDLERLATCMKRRVIVDFRNVLEPSRLQAHGFWYHGVGRASITPHKTSPRRPQRQLTRTA